MTTTAPSAPSTATASRRTSWVPVGLALFVVAWGGNQFTPLMVMYRETGGFSLAVVDLLLAAYVIGIVPGMLVGGPLSDRWGRRPVMLTAPPLAVLGSVVLAAGGDVPAVLFVGRVLAGLALGVAMAVGSTWIAELSRLRGGAASGASRSALALTGGFLLGPALAGVLAQWAPWPYVLPYVAHVVLTVPLGLLALRTTETLERAASAPVGRLRDDLRVPVRGHRRFWTVVGPLAPWVFTCAGVAYAVLPSLVSQRVPGHGVAWAAAMTAITLVAGVVAQSLARRHDLVGVRGGVAATLASAVGMGLAAWTAADPTLVAASTAAVVLGAGYGFALVAGLAETQRLAAPEHLAGLTAVFYGLAYSGFLVPVVLALCSTFASYPAMFGVAAAFALLCLGVLVLARHAPDPDTR